MFFRFHNLLGIVEVSHSSLIRQPMRMSLKTWPIFHPKVVDVLVLIMIEFG